MIHEMVHLFPLVHLFTVAAAEEYNIIVEVATPFMAVAAAVAFPPVLLSLVVMVGRRG